MFDAKIFNLDIDVILSKASVLAKAWSKKNGSITAYASFVVEIALNIPLCKEINSIEMYSLSYKFNLLSQKRPGLPTVPRQKVV